VRQRMAIRGRVSPDRPARGLIEPPRSHLALVQADLGGAFL